MSAIQSIDASTFTTQRVFDAATRRLSGITYPDTARTLVSYTYDADGNLYQVSEPGTVHATLTNYNERGQVGTIAFGDSTTTAYTYDPNNGRTTHINTKNGTGSVLLDQAYGYDLAGNVLSVADGLNVNNSRTYAYDELNRLTSSSSNSYQSSAGLPLAGLTYGYDPVRVHVLNSTSDGRTFVHDHNGNRQSDGVRSITWSPDNLPVSLVASGTTISLAYDGKGRRVKKVAPSGSTLYSGSLYECNGGACVRHIFAGSLRIASISATGPSFVHSDRLGSTAIISNTQGIQGSIAYLPFGQTLNDSTAGVVGRYKFNGQEYDSETGLYNYGARLYDPAIGRFVSADPVMVGIGAPQTFNRYSYALNNPMGYIDPSGHFPVAPILIGAAVGAIVGGIWAGVTGNNVLEGMAIGAVSGAALGSGNAFIQAYGIKSAAGMAAVYGATGAGSGALNAGVHHGNIAAGAIAGGALGVLGSTMPTYLPILDDGWPAAAQVSANRILTASASGAVLGGAEAAMSGGSIGEGARRGAEAGAIGGAFNLAVGLGMGFYSSGWRGPTSIDRGAGAIYFENALPGARAYLGVSIGGVITAGPGQLGAAAYRAPGFTVRDHELAHAGLQLEALGPGYVPIHLLSQVIGGMLGNDHLYNLFESGFIDVPDW